MAPAQWKNHPKVVIPIGRQPLIPSAWPRSFPSLSLHVERQLQGLPKVDESRPVSVSPRCGPLS